MKMILLMKNARHARVLQVLEMNFEALGWIPKELASMHERLELKRGNGERK